MTITDKVIRSVLGSPDIVVVASNNVTYIHIYIYDNVTLCCDGL
jgi:hypothetical protein